ncbi:MAG: hypothetical protein JSV19_10020 [Phycisphaerales bacterium]|nr:MAG: hypothetical protein JSV19_10020 [Phycisphaerales bacterium]
MSRLFSVCMLTVLPAVVLLVVATTIVQAQTTCHVDDDAPSDPGPGDPTVSDPLEDGSAQPPSVTVPITAGARESPVMDRVTVDPPEIRAGHREQIDDPPGVVPDRRSVARGASRSTWTVGSYTSIQVNVDASGANIPDDAANEPSIAIDPTNPGRIVIGWRQFDTIASNFRQAGWAYSHDAGHSWTFPGVLQPGVFRSDPVLDSDTDGNFYYQSARLTSTGDVTNEIFRSTDGGISWEAPLPAYGGDKNWMVIDRTDSMGRGNIYAIWQRFSNCCGDDTFTRSTNGGASFIYPIHIPGSPTFGTIAVGPDGEVYAAGIEAINFQNFDVFIVAKSTDACDPSMTPSFVTTYIDLGGSLRFGIGPNPDGLLGQAWVATDHSSGATRGNVYALCSVDPAGPDPLDVMFTRSTDGGSTWSNPVQVNDVRSGWQWFGTMSVAPTGRIDVIWNDTRNDPTGNESEVYYSYSEDAGVTWSTNEPVSLPFNHFLGYPNQYKLGDYYDMISDDLGVSLAYAATFNGEQDVYYLRIEAFDCNGNGIPDTIDIAEGTSMDCQPNGHPDECDIDDGMSWDCNNSGIPDECDVAEGTSEDCNGDIVPDECQITGNDCNGNVVPDDCEPDCNGNDIPDDCDIAGDPGLDLNVNGIPDSCEAEPRLECGVVAVGDSAVTVPLNNTYDSPVVVCSAQYDNNTLPVVTRVSNVTPTSFDVHLQNPSGNPVTTDNVSYLVIEEGVSTIDGVEFEAWTYTSTVVDLNLSWVGELQRHKRSHVNPVVLGQVMSENDPDWSVFWCQGATAGDPPSPTLLRTGKHVGSDLDVTRAPETVGVIVTEAGHSTIGGVGFEARLGDATVQGVDNAPPYPYSFDTAFATAPTVAVVSQAGMIGADGSWAQAYGPTLATTTTLNLSLDEDQLEDTERRHTPERVAYAVFEHPLVYPSVGDGDFDLDGDVDLKDFGGFQVCFDQTAGGGCQPGDMNGDDFIDAADIAPFVNTLIGP